MSGSFLAGPPREADPGGKEGDLNDPKGSRVSGLGYRVWRTHKKGKVSARLTFPSIVFTLYPIPDTLIPLFRLSPWGPGG